MDSLKEGPANVPKMLKRVIFSYLGLLGEGIRSFAFSAKSSSVVFDYFS